jgi:putative ABC transport system permease protein
LIQPEILETAVRRFRTHPLQMWLTLTGLVVGTASVIFVVSLGLTGRGYVMSQIEGVGSRLTWANYRGTVTSGISRTIDDDITDADAKAVEERGDLFSGVTPLIVLHGHVTALGRSSNLTVLGAAANYPVVRKNLRMLRGRFLDNDDVERKARVCVVNRHLYEELFGRDEAQEKTIRTLGLTFAVIGEFEEPVDTLGQGDVTPETIFVPITVTWFFTPTHRVDTLFAEVREFRQIPLAVRTMEEILAERHHSGSQYEVQSMTSVIRVANAISLGLLVVFILVAAVSVVVGGVGIMNILLASVEQRTREIGLRMSVGATRRDILSQFLVEALSLGVAGSALGTALGLALPLLGRLVVHGVAIRISALSAVLAFGFSCAITLLFGVVPAYRAANLNPVEALHHE